MYIDMPNNDLIIGGVYVVNELIIGGGYKVGRKKHYSFYTLDPNDLNEYILEPKSIFIVLDFFKEVRKFATIRKVKNNKYFEYVCIKFFHDNKILYFEYNVMEYEFYSNDLILITEDNNDTVFKELS